MTDAQPMTLADCQALDAADPLAAYRERFSLPKSGALHFDANSIGAMPSDARDQEFLYQHDTGLARVRRLQAEEAGRQLDALAARQEAAE